jgi:citrate lyase beta subunit
MAHYGTREAWVVTQSSFTAGARELAANCGVRLVDGNTLRNLMAQANMELVTAAPSPATADKDVAQPVRDVPEDMLSLTDVCARWGCSPARVKAEISAGMPMVKTPSGRWAISPEDVAAWERHRAREAATLRRARKIRAAIPWAVGLVAFALLIAFIGRLVAG